jgi:hypothetical protein
MEESLLKKARISNNSLNLARVKPSKKSSSIEYNFEFFLVVFLGSQFIFMNHCYNWERARKNNNNNIAYKKIK